MADRTQRPTVQTEIAGANRPTTEQIQIVVPNLDRTVTVTEVGGPSVNLSEVSDHRATLVLVAGPAPGQVYSLLEDNLIGRDALASIQIDDGAVSRRHARVVFEEGAYYIEDLGSSNSTLVGGKRVRRQQLSDGDRIQLGPRVLLRFGLVGEAEERMQRQLFDSSTRDPLTQTYNKKYLNERLTAEVAHAQRHHSSLEVILFDLDRFKLINDVHGHLVGDAVLRSVADRVHELIRTEDVFGRFGGEEFVLLTRDCDAAKLAERIRAAIEQLKIASARGELRVTISLGVARLDELPEDATATKLLDTADQRLLRAKSAGRNRVCSEG